MYDKISILIIEQQERNAYVTMQISSSDIKKNEIASVLHIGQCHDFRSLFLVGTTQSAIHMVFTCICRMQVRVLCDRHVMGIAERFFLLRRSTNEITDVYMLRETQL